MARSLMTSLLLFLISAEARGQARYDLICQLAFTTDSSHLLVLDYHVSPRPALSRMRLFSTADWKKKAGTEGLEVYGPQFALSRGRALVVHGNESWTGMGSPAGPYRYYATDFQTLKLKEFRPVHPSGDKEIRSGPSSFACTDDKLLFVFSHGGSSRDYYVPYIVDRKSEKKTELAEFPVKQVSWLFSEFSSDGKRVLFYVERENGLLQFQLYSADNGKLLKTIGIDSPVHAISQSADGNKLAAYCANGEILMVESDLSKKNTALKIEGKTRTRERQTALAFVGNDHLAVFAERGVNEFQQMEGSEIKLYDTKEWKLRRTFEKNGTWTRCIAGSPNGKWLAAGFGINGSVPGTVCIWEADSGKLVQELK